MGRPHGDDRIEIREGLYIYVRESPVWQVYFKLNGSQKTTRRSLRTKDLTEARRLALEAYDEARLRQKAGKPQSGISFKKLTEDYLASLRSGVSKNYHNDTIRRHLTPFFEKRLPDICEITEADLLDYIQHRRAKLTKFGQAPKDQTLNRESVVVRGLLKHAVKRGYLTKNDVPDLPLIKTKTNRRPAFSRTELAELLEKAKARIDETKNEDTKRHRQLLYDWIVVQAHSGMRPEESLKLTWGEVHLDDAKPYLHIPAKLTKRRKERNSYPEAKAIEQLRDLKARQTAFLAQANKKLSSSNLVFSVAGKSDAIELEPILSFKNAFNGLLDACSFPRTKPDGNLSPESLRHTYATIRLEEGTDQHRLADNIGSSAEMIRQHYGHINLGHFHDELTKTRDERQKPQGDMTAINEKFDQVVNAMQKNKAETVVDIVRQQILKEHGPYNPNEPGGYEIFEGLVLLKMKELGQGDLYEPPDDLPDSLKD